MIAIALFSWLLAIIINMSALQLKHLWWIFNTIAACTALPTLMAFTKRKLNKKTTFWSIIIAFFVGVPIFIYANITANTALILSSIIFIIFTTGLGTLALNKQNKPL